MSCEEHNKVYEEFKSLKETFNIKIQQFRESGITDDDMKTVISELKNRQTEMLPLLEKHFTTYEIITESLPLDGILKPFDQERVLMIHAGHLQFINIYTGQKTKVNHPEMHITNFSILPENKCLISSVDVTGNSTIRILDLDSANVKTICNFDKHIPTVFTIEDEKCLASKGDGKLLMLDLKTSIVSELDFKNSFNSSSFRGCVLSDGKIAITSFANENVLILDPKNQTVKELNTLQGDPKAVRQLGAPIMHSLQDENFLVADLFGTIQKINSNTGHTEILHTLKKGTKLVSFLELSPNLIIFATDEGNLMTLNIFTGKSEEVFSFPWTTICTDVLKIDDSTALIRVGHRNESNTVVVKRKLDLDNLD